jgi:hypothetical protein
MSSRLRKLATILLVAALTGALPAAAADKQPDPALPTLRFVADAVTNGFFDEIRRAPQFQKLSREAVGSALELRSYHTYRINRGSATATGLLAAATLGLFPQVSNGEHSIVYELVVNGVPLSSYKYERSLTHTRSLWMQDTTHGMGAEGVKWANSTVELFIRDAAADPKLAALKAEFEYYFVPAKQ